MHYYTAFYTTWTEAKRQYCKQMREYEREFNYNRTIVCSIPEREISFDSVLMGQDERWKPG